MAKNMLGLFKKIIRSIKNSVSRQWAPELMGVSYSMGKATRMLTDKATRAHLEGSTLRCTEGKMFCRLLTFQSLLS